LTADAHVMTERELQAQVVDLAHMLGYLVYHTHDSRRSEPGFPDLVMVHERSGALIFAELKSSTGRVTAAQDRWLRALAFRGRAFVWRPEHLRDQSIVHALQRHARTGPPA
jgi:hypothetical protein